MKQNIGLIALFCGIVTALYFAKMKIAKMEYPLPKHSFSWPPDPPIDANAIGKAWDHSGRYFTNYITNSVTGYYAVDWPAVNNPNHVSQFIFDFQQAPAIEFVSNGERVTSITNGNWFKFGNNTMIVRATDEQWALLTNAFAK